MRYLSIDLGASSGRVMVISKEDRITIEEIKRFETTTEYVDENHTIIKIDQIFQSIVSGLYLAFNKYPDIVSIGIDTWGVDYGYVTSNNTIIPPFFYRSLRTKKHLEAFKDIYTHHELYQQTGIQSQYFNTIYQMFDDKRSQRINKETSNYVLLLPDLIAYLLTDKARMELTNLSTTSLYHPIKKQLIEKIDEVTLGRELFAEMIYPTQSYGTLKPLFHLPEVPVIAVCTHDTASAIVSLPLTSKDLYISSGSWSLLGVLLDQPNLSDQAETYNFTNEIGFDQKVRFLKNINGLYIVNEVIKQFKSQSIQLTYDDIYEHIDRFEEFHSLIDVNHPIFEHPKDMIHSIQHFCQMTQQTVPYEIGEIFKTLFESLAHRYALEIEHLTETTNQNYRSIYVIGGGGQIDFINQLMANLTGLEVKTGPKESTILGNGIVQMLASGDIQSIEEGQLLIQASFQTKTFMPQPLQSKSPQNTYKKIIERGNKNVHQ